MNTYRIDDFLNPNNNAVYNSRNYERYLYQYRNKNPHIKNVIGEVTYFTERAMSQRREIISFDPRMINDLLDTINELENQILELSNKILDGDINDKGLLEEGTNETTIQLFHK